MNVSLAVSIGFLTLAMGLPAAAQSGFKVLVNPGDQGEQSRFAVYSQYKQALELALNKTKVAGVVVTMSTDATADLAASRSRLHDVYLAPAHVVGSALRFGFAPVAAVDKPVQAVLVTLSSSPVSSLAQTAGKPVGLPSQDSIVTYLLRGELNAANTTLKRHFGSVYQTRYQDALLPCLQIKRCEVVAVERAVFDRWVSAGEPVKVVMQSRVVPGLSVVVRDGTKPGAEALGAALTEALVAAGAPKPTPTAVADFDYVSTLGYFTPRALQGAQVVDAAEVARLLQAGAVYVDTRTDVEFKAGRPAGAIWVPYVEKSAKDADFKASDDQFNLAQLPTDKQTPLVFACNGAECWKSYKASLAAIKAGHTRVHWFRGGFPEWRAAGLKTASGG